jgi:DNA replication protein DnaD
MHRGYIKIYRALEDHWIFQREDYFRAWTIILFKVNHVDKKVLINTELIECKRGESLMSLQSWSECFGKNWTLQKVRTFFSLLRNDGMINIKGLRKTTCVSVCNYNIYL